MTALEIESLKLEIVRQVVDLDDPSILARIWDMVQGQSHDFADQLTDVQAQAIQLGLAQLARGERMAWDDVLAKHRK